MQPVSFPNSRKLSGLRPNKLWGGSQRLRARVASALWGAVGNGPFASCFPSATALSAAYFCGVGKPEEGHLNQSPFVHSVLISGGNLQNAATALECTRPILGLGCPFAGEVARFGPKTQRLVASQNQP